MLWISAFGRENQTNPLIYSELQVILWVKKKVARSFEASFHRCLLTWGEAVLSVRGWCSKKSDLSPFLFSMGLNGDFKLCANSLGIACHRFIPVKYPIESSWNVCLWKPTVASWHPTLASPWHPYRIDSANAQKTRGTPSKERDEVGDDFCDPKGLKQTEW